METLVKYQAEIKMMVELSSLINSSLDIQNVLDNALFCIEQFIDAEVSSIFEVDHEKGELFFLLTRGHDSERIKKISFEDRGRYRWMGGQNGKASDLFKSGE